jgi:hypothetical protein
MQADEFRVSALGEAIRKKGVADERVITLDIFVTQRKSAPPGK